MYSVVLVAIAVAFAVAVVMCFSLQSPACSPCYSTNSSRGAAKAAEAAPAAAAAPSQVSVHEYLKGLLKPWPSCVDVAWIGLACFRHEIEWLCVGCGVGLNCGLTQNQRTRKYIRLEMFIKFLAFKP